MSEKQNMIPDEQPQNVLKEEELLDNGEQIEPTTSEPEDTVEDIPSSEDIPDIPAEPDDLAQDAAEEPDEDLEEDAKEEESISDTAEEQEEPECDESTESSASEEETAPIETAKPLSESPSLGMPNAAAAAAHAAGVLVLKPIHLAIASVLIACLIGGGIFLGVLLGKSNSDIDKNAQDFEWVIPDGSQPNVDGITLPGYASLLLPADTRDVGILLPNPSQNPCHFRFTFTLVETGEVIYQSGLVPPGMALKNVHLNRPLTKGDYQMEIRIDTTSVQDGTPLNGGTMTVLVQVR